MPTDLYQFYLQAALIKQVDGGQTLTRKLFSEYLLRAQLQSMLPGISTGLNLNA
jgi:hypothetical protein